MMKIKQSEEDEYERVMKKYCMNEELNIEIDENQIDQLHLNQRVVEFNHQNIFLTPPKHSQMKIETNIISNSPTPSYYQIPKNIDINFTKELVSSQQNLSKCVKFEEDDAQIFSNSEFEKKQSPIPNKITSNLLAQSIENFNKSAIGLQTEEESIRYEVKISEMNFKLKQKENLVFQLQKQVDILEIDNMNLKKMVKNIGINNSNYSQSNQLTLSNSYAIASPYKLNNSPSEFQFSPQPVHQISQPQMCKHFNFFFEKTGIVQKNQSARLIL